MVGTGVVTFESQMSATEACGGAEGRRGGRAGGRGEGKGEGKGKGGGANESYQWLMTPAEEGLVGVARPQRLASLGRGLERGRGRGRRQSGDAPGRALVAVLPDEETRHRRVVRGRSALPRGASARRSERRPTTAAKRATTTGRRRQRLVTTFHRLPRRRYQPRRTSHSHLFSIAHGCHFHRTLPILLVYREAENLGFRSNESRTFRIRFDGTKF